MARDYWKDRQAQALTNLTNRGAKAIEVQLKKYYKQTMERSIADFEATYDKLLATMEAGREPTPADLYKLDKYWQAQAQLKDELAKLGDKEAALFSKQFESEYKNVYDMLARDSGAHYNRISTQGAQQMINQVWAADGKSWSARIWDNTADLAETLNEKLIECVVGGKKTSELKQALMDRFNVSYSRADALARTELAHIQTQAARQRYEDTGIEWVEIWADKDERQCEYCGKLHQKRYPVNAQIPIPAHPRCRCTIVPVVNIPDEEIIEQQQPQEQAFNEQKYKSFESGEQLNQFFYYDNPEDKGLLKKRNSAYGKWQQSLTDDEKNWLTEYTTDAYYDINNYHRQYGDWQDIDAGRIQQATQHIDSAINKFELKEDIKVYRAIQPEAFEAYFDDIQQLVGTTYTDAGYMSSSPLKTSTAVNKDCIMELFIPQGKGRGAYINELSAQYKDGEYEFLIKRDAQFKIMSVEETEDKVVFKMEWQE